MMQAPPLRPIGPEHREYEQQQPGRYRPEAPQATHEVESLLSQLADLVEAQRTVPLYEQKLSLVWDQIRLHHVLMAGAERAGIVSLTEMTRPDFLSDLDRARELVKDCHLDPAQVTPHPTVSVEAGSDNPNQHMYEIKGMIDRPVKVLREAFTQTFRDVSAMQREQAFFGLYVDALQLLDEAQAISSKWGLWGPRSKLYRTELTNSVDRLRQVIQDGVRQRMAEGNGGA